VKVPVKSVPRSVSPRSGSGSGGDSDSDSDSDSDINFNSEAFRHNPEGELIAALGEAAARCHPLLSRYMNTRFVYVCFFFAILLAYV
jgi:hypothetical protein